jgi:hypothetical protein
LNDRGEIRRDGLAQFRAAVQFIAAIESSSEDNVMNVSLLGRGVKVKMSCRMFNFSEVVIYNV